MDATGAGIQKIYFKSKISHHFVDNFRIVQDNEVINSRFGKFR